ncbi:Fc.00g052190.m01.CDS01 [Cosmosporella sp. VM-42]
MDSLDGMLMVPPDRGQILGRAVWKSRYVVVGRRTAAAGHKDHQSQPSYSQLVTSSRNGSGPKPLAKAPTDECCLLIYKHKEDSEPQQQWPINCISGCDVQMLAHRKQGPVLPTMVVTISDKERKRRSSRAAGLISANKEPSATTLLFRTPPDDHHPSLHEWARFILSKKSPMSPDSPMSPKFSNPFSSRSRDTPDYFPRPTSGSQSHCSDGRGLQHKGSANTYSTGTRERPVTFSSASLRSKRSDVSSPSSTNYPIQTSFPIPGQHYTTVLPTDIPSPVTTIGEYQGEFIEGWTSAQGRSSTMSSPIRGRDSLSSQTPQPSVTATEASSPPGPRETILDRAFQLRCIPGSEREVPGEEHLSSLARFDALMREADDRRKQREAAERAEQIAMRSAFEASDSSEEDDEVDSDGTDDAYGTGRRSPALIPPTAQRALQFIAGRHESSRSTPSAARPPVSKTPMGMRADHLTQAPPMRPHTAHAKSRPNAAQRTQSTPQLTPSMAKLDISASTNKSHEDGAMKSNAEKRQSTSSTKRLSFTEFTKRLSSTSSLLLVQTNASGGSSRGSSEIDIQSSSIPRGALNPRGTGPPPRDHDGRCGWRNSVGVLGNEGGFL